jgi:endonuclease/exonuclease/phosphatase family metal-dependent hydrolase
MELTDRQRQVQETEPIALARGLPLAAPLPAGVITAFAGIKKRRQLVQSAVYGEHEQGLLDLTYALEHRTTRRSTAPEPRSPDFVRVVSWNIQRGIHLDLIKSFLDGHPVLRHLDILLLNEVDIGMARSGNRNVAAELADHLGFHYVFGNSYLCLDFGDPRDGTPEGDNRESMHGNAVLSRFPFRRAENFSIAVSKDKFHSSERRLGHKKALWAEIETGLGPLPVVAVHLDSYASAAQRGDQLADVVRKIEQCGLGERVLGGGDLNTTTYDAKSVGQICLNLTRKAFRGGFPHAMHHYLHPYELYERPVFEQLEAAGLDYRSFNAMEAGTTRYEVGSYESESKVSELLPEVAVRILRRKLRPWNGVAQLKVDWFFGRGLEVVQGQGGATDGAALPLSPTPIARPVVDGTLLSDHDPIVVDVRWPDSGVTPR